MSGACKYLTAPREVCAKRPGDGRGWQAVTAPARSLCAWATFHPAAVVKLADTPSWLVRNALAGHLVQPQTDCGRCPCFEAGGAVE